jgi:hypothetical protein
VPLDDPGLHRSEFCVVGRACDGEL